jgi:hypothetical protein
MPLIGVTSADAVARAELAFEEDELPSEMDF